MLLCIFATIHLNNDLFFLIRFIINTQIAIILYIHIIDLQRGLDSGKFRNKAIVMDF